MTLRFMMPLLLITLVSGGCGYKGDLHLPDPEQKSNLEQPAPIFSETSGHGLKKLSSY